jgi:uncharacterized protein (DUF2252 family)
MVTNVRKTSQAAAPAPVDTHEQVETSAPVDTHEQVAVPPSANGHKQATATLLTVEERMARGRALRAKVPRSSHAFWAEIPGRSDPIALLESQEVIREPDLIPIRHARMRVSAFAFYRGSAIVMAEDLARTPTTGIQTQLCGDAHISNFGLYASPERTLLFDINDFDETLPGPWEWDVKRLAASAYIAGRGNAFSEVDCRNASLAAVRSYRTHMAQYAGMGNLDVWYTHVTADDLLARLQDQQTRKRAQQVMGKARQRNSMQALSKLTEVVDGQRIIASDPPLVTRITSDNLEEQLQGLFDAYMSTLRGAQRRLIERYRVVDFARKVVGVGSVGTRCFILLLLGRDENDPLFLQVKEAPSSVLERHLPKTEFAQEGQRVVAGQELMQAASDITLGWLRGPERDFYVRQLRDMKASVEIENLTAPQLALWADMCGWALARAHARAGDAVEITAYLGASDIFDRAIATFSEAYANQAERDYRALMAAIKSGRIAAATSGV